MIQVGRPTEVPIKLLNLGTRTNDANCKLFDSDPIACLNGDVPIKISNPIYGHRTVKAALRFAQNEKCCYCEKDQSGEDGHVEHFRPKEGYKSSKTDRKLHKPGYYWLGYDLDNLLFACGWCNGVKYKGNLFPLLNEKSRAKSHNDNISKERPVLINPSTENPRHHIVFDNEFPRGTTLRGRSTIKICGIDRKDLNDKRRKILNSIADKVLILLSGESEFVSEEK